MLVEANDLVMRRLERTKRRIVLDKYSDKEGFKKRRHWWWFVYEPCFNFIPLRIWSAAFDIWTYLDAITIL